MYKGRSNIQYTHVLNKILPLIKIINIITCILYYTLKGLVIVESALSLSSQFTGSLVTKQINYSKTTSQNYKPQLVGGNQLAIYKRGRVYNQEQIQQVATAGLEPRTAGFRVQQADHSATLPSVKSCVQCSFIIKQVL